MLFIKLMILWSRGLLEKLTVAQLLAVSNGIRRFIFVFTRSPYHHHHWTPYKSLVNVVIITYTPLVLEDVEFAVSNLAVSMDASSFSTNVSRITH
jgi:hypothetical protein